MAGDIEDEIALALAIALSRNAGNVTKGQRPAGRGGRGSAWRRGLERRHSHQWSGGHGWKGAARHESLRGW